MTRAVTRRTAIDDLPELLTVEEAAVWLAIGRGTVYELVRRGDIGSIRLGKLVRVPREALAVLARGRGRA